MSQEDAIQISTATRNSLTEAGIDVDAVKNASKAELIKLLGEVVDSEAELINTNAEDSVGEDASASSDNTHGTSPNTSDSSRSTTSNEGSPEYQRPIGFTPTPAQSFLVECASDNPQKPRAKKDLLGLTESKTRNVLLIQYHSLSDTELKHMAENAQRVKLITIDCEQSIPSTVEDTITTTTIDSVSDVTELGIVATTIADDWSGLDAQTSVAVDSIDVVSQQKTAEGLFRFLHIFIGKLRGRETISYVFVDPTVVDETDRNTLKPLFEGTISITDSEVNYTAE